MPSAQATLLLLICVYTLGQSTAQGDLGSRVGIAIHPAGRPTCAVLPDTSLRAGAPLTLFWPPLGQVGGAPGRYLHTTVRGRTADCGWLQAPNDAAYELQDTIEAHVPFLVVIGRTRAPTLDHAQIEVDLTGDGHPEYIRVCTSVEGVHSTIWSRASLSGTRLLHRYVPLGYDVEPSCHAAETAMTSFRRQSNNAWKQAAAPRPGAPVHTAAARALLNAVR